MAKRPNYEYEPGDFGFNTRGAADNHGFANGEGNGVGGEAGTHEGHDGSVPTSGDSE